MTAYLEEMARVSVTQDILEALHDPVILVDDKREVVTANSAARRLFAADLVGRDIALSIRHPDILDALDMVLAEASEHDIEVTLARPVPTIYRVRAAALASTGESREPRALITFQDMTSAKQAERMRADFVANVSHELRSPLTSLVGFIETLRGAAREDKAARERFLEVMDGEAKRMARLIDDLLSLSRVEADEHLSPQGEVELPNLLREIADNLEMRATKRGMSIEIRPAENLRAALGERDELTLVFRNLLDNAISYGSQGTPVIVEIKPAEHLPGAGGPGVAVAVSNRGEGIAAEHIPRLTERFYRVDKGRSRSMGGTGLGLAIVKHIVNRHRGRLAIESQLGEGSVFTVYLPCI